MKLNAYLNNLREVLGDLYNPAFNIIKALLILILAAVAVKAGSALIRKVFEKQKVLKFAMDTKRIDTMTTLVVSLFRYTVYILAGITVLSYAFELKSVLAAAGIGGLAIGFGAQSLIKDVISGFFIIMEDQFAVGDLVTIENMSGTVEEMELRITKLRNYNGDLYIIPNGEIKRLTNHTRGNKAVIVDIPLAYSTDVNKAFEAASRVCEAVKGQFDTLVEEPKVLGITAMDKSGMNLRIMAKTLPNEHWEIERRIRKLVKEEFSTQGLQFYDRNKLDIDGGLKGE